MTRGRIQDALPEASATVFEDQFWAVRGKAVNAYANLEQALCHVFANESATTDHIAAIIFFKITSTQARNDILDKLIRLRHGAKYSLFWNSVIKSLRPIDLTRNEIVHWTVVASMSIGLKGLGDPEIALHPRTFWDDPSDRRTTPRRSTDDMIKFIQKCNFYSKVINSFAIFVPTTGKQVRASQEIISAWHDVFQKPLTYPLPEGIQLP